MGANLFADCKKLSAINIPNKVKVINVRTFQNCVGLTNIVLPKAVNNIKHSAFLNCTNLNKIDLPSTLKSIGVNAFTGCIELAEVFCRATTPPTANAAIFSKTPTSKKLYVPKGSKKQYSNNATWGETNFAEIEEF